MIWSVEEQDKLASLWMQGASVNEIAAAVKRPSKTIQGKATRMGLAKRNKSLQSKRDEPPRVKRKCLRCRKDFWAEKQYFICRECKSTTEWRSQGGSFL